jgi:phosphoribosyl-AMP cyclohydrolase / phosphoribosyl-ATP pyrophosphohydrolase
VSERELRAAIIQDEVTGDVLMLGWMDDDALALTRTTNDVHFFSRSRQRLWKKGETSGNVMHVTSIDPDCDDDALLIRVHPEGPACHDGSTSCFTPWLWRRILQRELANDDNSYVVRQLRAGVAANAQKVGEEATEVVVAALAESDERLVAEAADLWFHLLLVLRSRGLDPAAVDAELRRRVHE